MEISDKELQAALMTLAHTDAGDHVSAAEMRSALEAAYTVRKARKAAKRAEANQKQTVYHVSLGEIDFNALRRQLADKQEQAETSKPEWNGKFEVGKAYRTRDGERAEIEGTLYGSYQFHGYVGNKSNGRVWTECGKILDVFEFNHADDLIVPWVD